MIDLNAEGGIILLDKPYTWTSFQVVKKVKYSLIHYFGRKIKVGHAGTLDPLATGLLIICVGKYTKQIPLLQEGDKEYIGQFTLGAITASYDMEKPVSQAFSTEHITKEKIKECAESFLGVQQQVPPIFSAVKIDGKRAYKLARADQQVELKPKDIEIKEFEITNIDMPKVDFRVVCSKGTYIRSLARDFGLALQSGAYLSALRRTRIGDMYVKDAISPEELVQELAQTKIEEI